MAETSSTTPDPIIAELRQIRLDRKLKQNAAANLIGIGPSVMSAYEAGSTSPQLDTVRTWVRVMDLDLRLIPGGAAKDPRAVSDELSAVRLTRYQTALAMGMLVAAGQRGSDQMSRDLMEIADLLAQSLGR